MKKKNIIKKNEDFSRIINKRQRVSSRSLAIYYQKNKVIYPRFGISVGKKLGNAVFRNRVRRQVRSVLHEKLKTFNLPLDCIIMIRKTVEPLPYLELEKELTSLINRLK